MTSIGHSSTIQDVEKSNAAITQNESLHVSSLQISQALTVSPQTCGIDHGNRIETVAESREIVPSVLVTWDSEDDTDNPHNWSASMRWCLTILVSFASFITMMSGSMIAPALSEISHDLRMSEASAGLALSVFVLALAIGPLFAAPFSEIYGRRPIWLACGTIYSIWNIFCGFAHNKGMLVAGRLLSGLGGSVGSIMAFPVTSDIWRPEERGKSIMISSLMPVLGPALGPLIGGIMTDTIGWRWIFWWAAIVNGCLIVAAIFLFPETSAAAILGRKARKLVKATGLSHHTEYEPLKVSLTKKLTTNLSRPYKLMFTQPILVLASLYWTYSFGLLYFFLSTYSQLFTTVYNQTVLQSGLHYLAVAVGFIIAEQAGAILMDKLWAYLTTKRGVAPLPEYRVPLLIPGGVLIPIGLLWYGWSAQARVHWIMCDIGAAIFACGFMLIGNATAAYILDSFPKFTASAMAVGSLMRMTMGFIFPIFSPAMYNRLGWGWSTTTLALVAIVVGFPIPWILWTFGARIRAMGKSVS